MDLQQNIDFILNREQVRKDSKVIKDNIKGTTVTAEKSARDVQRTVKRVYDQNVKEVSEYNQALGQTNKAQSALTANLARARPQWNGLNNSINQLTRELPAFTFSAQTGFLALSNNIPILADEIQRLKVQNQQLVASGQKGIPVWRRITSALLSWNTALSLGVTILTVYGREITEYIGSLFKSEKVLDRVAKRQELLNAAFEAADYKTAISEITELRAVITNAKAGIIDSEQAVKKYNDTLGDTTGKVGDLETAEQNLINKSDDYIKMMLFKAAAATAATQAADALVKKQQELDQALTNQQAFNRKRASVVVDPSQVADSAQAEIQRQFIQGINDQKSVGVVAAEKEIDELTTSYQKIIDGFYEKIGAIAKKNDFNLFGDEATGGGNNSILRSRQRLLDQIAALDKEYARKNLEGDAAELQALKDKFAKIRELIERFNADPKNKAATISLSGLDEVQERSETQLAERQSAAREKLARKEFMKQLAELKSYQQQREKLIRDFRLLESKLIEGGYDDELSVLQKKHVDELNALDDQQLAKLQSYQDLNAGIEKLTDEAARGVITNARKMVTELLKTGRISTEAAGEIYAKIDAAEESLANRSAANAEQTEENIRRIARSISVLGDALTDLGRDVNSSFLAQAGGILTGLGQGVDALLTVFSDESSKADKISAGIGGLVNMIDMLAQAAVQRKEAEERYYQSVIGFQRDYNLGLQEQIRLESELAESVFIKDYEGRITDGLDAVSNASKEYQEALKELNNATVISGQRNAVDLGNIGKGIGSGAAIGATVGSIVPVIGTAIGAGIGALVGGLAGLFGGKKKKDELLPILEEYPELIEQTEDGLLKVNRTLAESLLSNELLNESSKEILTTILEWDKALEAAKEQIREVISDLSGSLSGDLRNALVEAFQQGEDSAVAMGETVEEVLENILSNLIFNRVFSDAFNQLEDEMARSFETGGDGNWVDDFSRFFTEADGLTDQFNQALRDAQNQAKGFGFDVFDENPGNQSGLTGAIRRELSEQTASELTGLYRATFDLQRNDHNLNLERFALEQKAIKYTYATMLHTAMIEEHTAATVIRLDEAVTELKEIKRHVKPSRGGRDIGG